MIETKKYYVYEWYIKETNEIFYVGKGTDNRATTMKGRNEYFKNIRKKYDCDYRIIKYFDDEQKAYDYELSYGKKLKEKGLAKASYVLGNFKRYIDKETKIKISNTLKSKKIKTNPWNKGKKMNESFRKKCRFNNLGKKQSEETKLKRSNSLKGHEVKKETRNKISNARKKEILLINIETKNEKIYKSIQDLANEFNITQSSLCRPLKQGKIYKKKYIVKYVNPEIKHDLKVVAHRNA